MNRKLFLSLLSTTPLIGVLPIKTKSKPKIKEIHKIQHAKINNEFYGDGYISVQFYDGSVVRFKERFTNGEFMDIVNKYMKGKRCISFYNSPESKLLYIRMKKELLSHGELNPIV